MQYLNEAWFFGIATADSNHNVEKMFPLVIQLFNGKYGQQSKLIKLAYLCNGHSEYCKISLENLSIHMNILIVYCNNNTNTHFRGLNRVGRNRLIRLYSET